MGPRAQRSKMDHPNYQSKLPRSPLAHTYSIIARDPATGEFGAAVQSHWFSVGGVIWAESEVGVVATQAFVDPAYGPLGLDLMRAGKSASDALAGLLCSDVDREVRQVAMLDAKGIVAVHTGERTIAEAGHIVGDNFTVQANMMLNATVWPAMARAFEASKGDLASRMLAALDAAEVEGGDIRGRQSAAIVVVRGKSTKRPWADKVFDVRVDDHQQPLAELRRVVDVQRAYTSKAIADRAIAKGDLATGDREYANAERLAPGNPEFPFWHAVGVLSAGRIEEATTMFRRVFAQDRRWATLALRLVKPGIIALDETVVEEVIAKALGEK